MHPITIVIPTCARGALLARTLDSISAAEIPPSVHRLVVVENGERGTAEQVVRSFSDRLPIAYEHVPIPNKSRALNHVLYSTGDELMIFLDDDIQVHPKTFRAYATAAANCVSGFWGGKCCVEYEEEPPEWLKHYLPPSAKGWSMGDEPCALDRPLALGFNWAAFTRELREACAFDETLGPGTRARGDETDMQKKLLEADIRGTYLPNAVVWHYVPKERCSEEWTIQRIRQTGNFVGATIAKKVFIKRLRHDVMAAARIVLYDALLNTSPVTLSPARRFHLRYRREWFSGVREGILGRPLELSMPSAHAPTFP